MKYFITTVQIIKTPWKKKIYTRAVSKSKYERRILIYRKLKSFWGTATDDNARCMRKLLVVIQSKEFVKRRKDIPIYSYLESDEIKTG